MQLPETDRYSMDKERMLNDHLGAVRRRIAEEVFMHQMTTGASNDFERATDRARHGHRHGMTDELGPMVYAENEGEVFLGRSVTKTEQHVRSRRCRRSTGDPPHHRRAVRVARKPIETTATRCTRWPALLEWETIDSDQIDDIMAGRAAAPPKDWTPAHPSPTPPVGIRQSGDALRQPNAAHVCGHPEAGLRPVRHLDAQRCGVRQTTRAGAP